MHYPWWYVPVLTSPMLIAGISVLHVLVSHYAVGGGLFLAVETAHAYRTENRPYLDYLRRHAQFFVLLTVVLGAITGVGIWWTIGLASPLATAVLIKTFVFGWAIGLGLGLTFVAVTWAGEIIGQQMGLGLGQVYDPQFGAGGSTVGELYFMLALVVFLCANGHHALLRGVAGSFEALPVLSLTAYAGILDLLAGLLTAATTLAVQLASPLLITVLVVDLMLGFIGKTVPQLNVMSAGLTLRAGAGLAVLVVGVGMASQVIQDGLLRSVESIARVFTGS